MKTTYYAFFFLVQKAWFKNRNFRMRQILKEKCTTCKILNQTFENVSELKKTLAFEKSRYEQWYSVKVPFFCIFPAFPKRMNEKKKFQRLIFWTNFLKTCQTLNPKTLKRLGNREKFSFRKSRFELRYSRKTTCSAFFLLLRKTWFWVRNFTKRLVLK